MKGRLCYQKCLIIQVIVDMTKKNELLDQDIEKRIEDARYEKGDTEKNTKSIFYIIIVCLVTLSVILSLLRYLR